MVKPLSESTFVHRGKTFIIKPYWINDKGDPTDFAAHWIPVGVSRLRPCPLCKQIDHVGHCNSPAVIVRGRHWPGIGRVKSAMKKSKLTHGNLEKLWNF